MKRLSSSVRPWQPNLMDVESCSAWHIYLPCDRSMPHQLQSHIDSEESKGNNVWWCAVTGDSNRGDPFRRRRKSLEDRIPGSSLPLRRTNVRDTMGSGIQGPSRLKLTRRRCSGPVTDRLPTLAMRLSVEIRSSTAICSMPHRSLPSLQRDARYFRIQPASVSTTDTPHSAIRIRRLGFLASSRGSGRRRGGDAIAGCSATWRRWAR